MTSVPNIYWESRCVCTLFLLRYCAYIYTFVKVLTILDFLKVLRICTVPRGSIQKANDGYRSGYPPYNYLNYRVIPQGRRSNTFNPVTGTIKPDIQEIITHYNNSCYTIKRSVL